MEQLLQKYSETNEITAVARQRAANRGMAFSARSTKQQLNSNRGTVFPVRSVTICYKQDKC
jgi:hypothetical protein